MSYICNKTSDSASSCVKPEAGGQDSMQSGKNKKDRRGRTPLAWTVENCWVMASETLLSLGASPSQQQYGTNSESTPDASRDSRWSKY
jgi:hypothetical protein